MQQLQDSAVHEAGHVVVADFFDLDIVRVSLLPESSAGGMRMAHVGLRGRLEGPVGAAVLAAGEAAVELAGEDRFPVPAMPAGKAWHKRAISVSCRWQTEDGGAGDRESLRRLAGSAGVAMARRTARGILCRRWGSAYVVADGLLREGLLSGEQVAGLLHPGPSRRSRARVLYDASATMRGLFWGGGGRPAYADRYKEPERGASLR